VQTLDAMNAFARGRGLFLDLAKIPGAAVVQDAMAISHMDLNFRMHTVAVNVAGDLPAVHGDRQKKLIRTR
jgi:hypothetical protein